MDQLNAVRVSLNQLRCSVGEVFESLGNGVCDEESEFFEEFQELFNEVNSNLRQVEFLVDGLTASPALFKGYTAYLTHETLQERQALYPELYNCYNWCEKVHNYSSRATHLLNGNSLKRSYTRISKRSRIPLACNNTSPRHLDGLLNEIKARSSVQTNFKILRSFGSNSVVIVNIGRSLKAAIIFKSVMIEWVTVRGFDEPLDVADFWKESRYEVFRKVQEHTHSAMLHFFSQTLPDLAVKSYMTWINSYNKLFVDPCRRCGKYLHDALPPTWRDLRTLEPFHIACSNFYH